MKGSLMKRRIRFLILTLLALGPSHGYDLGRRIEEITGGEVRAGPGSIYPVLRELREEGLVEEEEVVEQGRLRKVYRLTLEGARSLYQQLQAFIELTNRFLSLAALALQRLEEEIREERLEECPPEELVEALRRAERALQEYISALEERLHGCRRGAGGGEGEEAGLRGRGDTGVHTQPGELVERRPG